MAETRVMMSGTAYPRRASRSRSATLLLAAFSMPASVALAADQIIVSGANQAVGIASPKSNVFMGPQAWFTHPPNERLARIPDAGTVSALRVTLTGPRAPEVATPSRSERTPEGGLSQRR